MKVSVIVPTKDYEEGLVRCLKSLRQQTYKRFEIIVVGTDKKTAKIANKYRAKFFLDTKKTIGNSYHVGASNATGDIIAFIDDDCVAQSGWLKNIVNEFKKDPELGVWGGEDFIDESKSTKFQKAAFQIDAARILKFPVYGKAARNRLRACNIAYRKKIFTKYSFNQNLISLQEPELHYRLLKDGIKMKFDPRVFVYHERRKTIRDVWNQMYRNGKAKSSVIRMHVGMTTYYDIAIFFALIATAAVLLYASIDPRPFIYWVSLIVAWFVLNPLYTLMKTKRLNFYPTLLKIIVVREIAYGYGLVRGILGGGK